MTALAAAPLPHPPPPAAALRVDVRASSLAAAMVAPSTSRDAGASGWGAARRAVLQALLRLSAGLRVADAVALSRALELVEGEAARDARLLDDGEEAPPARPRPRSLLPCAPLCGRAASVAATGAAAADVAAAAVASAAATTPSTPALSAHDALVLRESTRWLAFAAAAYEPTPAAVVAGLARRGVALTEADVLWAQLTPRAVVPAHFLARDGETLVLAIRGSMTWADLVSDLACEPVPFAGGRAHLGMAALVDGLLFYDVPDVDALGAAWAAAAAAAPARDASALAAPAAALLASSQALLAMMPAFETLGLSGVAILLQRALRAWPSSRVVLVGHSLGAGVAALLLVKLLRAVMTLHREVADQRGGGMALMPPRPWHAYAFAAPACASPELAALASLSCADAERVLCAALGEAGVGEAGPPDTAASPPPPPLLPADADAAAAGGPAAWPTLRELPLVHAVVLGVDVVPRLTLASLRDLARRCAAVKRPLWQRLSELNADVRVACGALAFGAVAILLLAARAVVAGALVLRHAALALAAACLSCTAMWWLCCFPAIAATAVAPAAAAAAAPAAVPAESAEAREAAPPAYAAVRLPLAELEARLGMTPPAHHALDAGRALPLRERLAATGIPAHLVADLDRRLGHSWIAPEQELVVPGVILHLRAERPAAGGAPVYRARAVPPAYLQRLVLRQDAVAQHLPDAYEEAVRGWLAAQQQQHPQQPREQPQEQPQQQREEGGAAELQA